MLDIRRGFGVVARHFVRNSLSLSLYSTINSIAGYRIAGAMLHRNAWGVFNPKKGGGWRTRGRRAPLSFMLASLAPLL